MRIGELSRLTGLTVHTIQYYERVGLLPFAHRGSSKAREYDRSVLPWIAFLGRLRTTGMPIRDMLRYATLRAQGTASEAERAALLVGHREHVRRHVTELQACLSVLDSKVAGYGDQPSTEQMDDTHHHRRREPLRPRPARAG